MFGFYDGFLYSSSDITSFTTKFPSGINFPTIT